MLKTFIKIAVSLLGAAAFWKVGSFFAKKVDDGDEVVFNDPPYTESSGDNHPLNVNSSDTINISDSSSNSSTNLPTVVNEDNDFITGLNKVQNVCTKACSVVQLAVSTINSLSQIFSKQNNMFGYTQNYSANPWEYSSNFPPPGPSVNYIPETNCAILRSPNSPIIRVIPMNNIAMNR